MYDDLVPPPPPPPMPPRPSQTPNMGKPPPQAGPSRQGSVARAEAAPSRQALASSLSNITALELQAAARQLRSSRTADHPSSTTYRQHPPRGVVEFGGLQGGRGTTAAATAAPSRIPQQQQPLRHAPAPAPERMSVGMPSLTTADLLDASSRLKKRGQQQGGVRAGVGWVGKAPVALGSDLNVAELRAKLRVAALQVEARGAGGVGREEGDGAQAGDDAGCVPKKPSLFKSLFKSMSKDRCDERGGGVGGD